MAVALSVRFLGSPGGGGCWETVRGTVLNPTVRVLPGAGASSVLESMTSAGSVARPGPSSSSTIFCAAVMDVMATILEATSRGMSLDEDDDDDLDDDDDDDDDDDEDDDDGGVRGLMEHTALASLEQFLAK
jgi:hypothetical protein